MRNTFTKVLSIICALVLVAFSITLCIKLVAMPASTFDICIGFAIALVSIAILCVVIRLCYMFRTPKVQNDDNDYDYEYYDEYEEIEPEPEIVSYSEMYLFANGGDSMMLVRQVQISNQ